MGIFIAPRRSSPFPFLLPPPGRKIKMGGRERAFREEREMEVSARFKYSRKWKRDRGSEFGGPLPEYFRRKVVGVFFGGRVFVLLALFAGGRACVVPMFTAYCVNGFRGPLNFVVLGLSGRLCDTLGAFDVENKGWPFLLEKM